MTYDRDMAKTPVPQTPEQEAQVLAFVPDVKIPLFTAAAILSLPTRTVERMEERGKITSYRLRRINGQPGERRYSLHEVLKLSWTDLEERKAVLVHSIDLKPEDRAKVYTAAEAAERLGIARNTLHSWASQGILRPQDWKLDRQSVYSRDEVERLIEERSM